MPNEMKMQKELGKFEAKVLIAVASGDPEKVAGLIEKEVLSGCNEREFDIYMHAMNELSMYQGNPIPDDIEDKIIHKDAGFGKNLKKALKDPISALQLGTLAVGLVPALAYGAKWLASKVTSRSLRNKVIKSDPVLKKNEEEAKKHFDMISSYAPALKKSPIVMKNLIKSWINTGSEYITHAHVDQLLGLQERFERTSSIGDVARATEIARNISIPIGEIGRIMMDRTSMEQQKSIAGRKLRQDMNLARRKAQQDVASMTQQRNIANRKLKQDRLLAGRKAQQEGIAAEIKHYNAADIESHKAWLRENKGRGREVY